MKFIHLSDLHLGKRLNEYSLLEDQEFILKRILAVIDEECPDGIIIAGDVYDKTVPPAEAVSLFDSFLVNLAKRSVKVFIISGNHDSAERLAFASKLIEQSGVHLSPVYDGTLQKITLSDTYGTVNVLLLPFIKPAHVRAFYPDEEIASYTDAVRVALKHAPIDISERNVLITHQFITNSQRSESEDISVGGTDNVDASVLEDFDYVALGHLHAPQSCNSQKIRYCGTPLKYSFSESKDEKSVTVVTLEEKGSLSVRTIPLIPMRDLVELKGSYDDLMRKSFYENTSLRNDYVHITLTDEEDVPDAIGKLRTVYKYLMKLDYDNTRTRKEQTFTDDIDVEKLSPKALFEELFEVQNNKALTDEQSEMLAQLVESIWEEKT